MLTGDEERTALTVAATTGIELVRAGMLPEQKLAFIRELQQQGRTVAMVGDGINDAAALAASDVGIAMGGGTDAAKQAGDVVLIGSRLSRILEAYTWSRYTMRNVHQNLLFALMYNVLTVPLAALGYLDPRIACIGMAASSLLVVGNSLRLQLWGKRGREHGLDRKRITVSGLGRINGAPHCLVMCGESFLLWHGNQGSPLKSVLAYNAGRVITYMAIGGFMGVVGSFLDVAGSFVGFQGAASIIERMLILLWTFRRYTLPIYNAHLPRHPFFQAKLARLGQRYEMLATFLPAFCLVFFHAA